MYGDMVDKPCKQVVHQEEQPKMTFMEEILPCTTSTCKVRRAHKLSCTHQLLHILPKTCLDYE